MEEKERSRALKKAYALERTLTSFDRLLWGSSAISIVNLVESYFNGGISTVALISIFTVITLKMIVVFNIWSLRAELKVDHDVHAPLNWIKDKVKK